MVDNTDIGAPQAHRFYIVKRFDPSAMIPLYMLHPEDLLEFASLLLR